MIDIETTGTDPAHAAIIQIAAVKFSLETKEIDTASMFCRSLWIPPGRFWDENTRDWWGRQNQDILNGIYDRMEDPRVVMNEFFDWGNGLNLVMPARMWAKPISFEYPFLSSYFKQFDLHMPFHFRYAKDVNTFLFAKGHDPSVFWRGVPPAGDAHHALFDVLTQIHGVFLA
jgi:DNA polymerase III epsilon subunit-like protein